MIERVPLPAYLPDQSNNSGVLLRAENVFPAQDGYRSIGSLYEITDALGATFMGGYSAIATDGTAYLLAGTTAGLYELESDGSWTTLVDGLTIGNRWRFAQFGDYVVAVNGSTTREVDLAGGTANALTDAPTGASIAVVGDYLVIGQAGGDISMVRWSAFRDHTGWTNGTNQAGELPMQSGGSVMAVAGGEYGIILQRERIMRMTRTGDADAPFQFDEISSNFGCASGSSVAQAGRTIFFLSDRGFMALDDGQVLKPIGSEKVDRTFIEAVARDDFSLLYTAVDPQNKLVFWCVPGAPGTVWIYNFELDRWSTMSLTIAGIMPGFTTSIGLDDLAVTYTNLDTMPYTLDDPRWSGGNPRLYCVSSARKIGTLTGDKLAARMDLGYNQFTPGRVTRMRSVRPITDAVSGMSLSVDAKARLGDSASLTAGSTLRTSGIMPLRTTGRYISTSLRVAAATEWNYVQALDYDFEPGGAR